MHEAARQQRVQLSVQSYSCAHAVSSLEEDKNFKLSAQT